MNADEIKAALEWSFTTSEPDWCERDAAQKRAEEFLVYAKVLARLRKPPEKDWTSDDPRLVAYLEVLENEVRVAHERTTEVLRSKPFDAVAFDVAASRLADLASDYLGILKAGLPSMDNASANRVLDCARSAGSFDAKRTPRAINGAE